MLVIDHICLSQWQFWHLQDGNIIENCRDRPRPSTSQILFGLRTVIVTFYQFKQFREKQFISRESSEPEFKESVDLEFSEISKNFSLYLNAYIHFQNAKMMGLFYGLSFQANLS